jgi:hypothetical protein
MTTFPGNTSIDSSTTPLPQDVAPDEIPQWAIKLTASVAIVMVTVICAASPKLATRVAVLFTSVKVRL